MPLAPVIVNLPKTLGPLRPLDPGRYMSAIMADPAADAAGAAQSFTSEADVGYLYVYARYANGDAHMLDDAELSVEVLAPDTLAYSLTSDGRHRLSIVPDALAASCVAGGKRALCFVASDQERARRLRELLAHYEENRDLVSVGAYRQGADPLMDQAIQKIGSIERLLYQGKEPRTAADTAAAMQQVAGV